jgi:hypothetical protein
MGSLTRTRQQERLRRRLAHLLEGALGLNIFPCPPPSAWRFARRPLFWDDYREGLQIGLLYASLFCALPWVLFRLAPAYFPKPAWALFCLQLYGSLWSGWATATARVTSASVAKTIGRNIIPELSAEVADAICHDLRRHFGKRRLLLVSWSIAVVGAATAALLSYHDAPDPKPPIGEIIWWSAGWAILFATGAKVVCVGCFYRVFAAHLGDDPARLYAMDPARSTLVMSVASVGQQILLFWFGMAVSIALIILFAVLGLPSIDYSTADTFIGSMYANFGLKFSNSSFVLAEMSITGFFSIGFGTIVFLRSEAAIRRAVENVTQSTLRLIEDKAGDLAIHLQSPDEAGLARLEKLNALHTEVATAGSYRSLIVSSLSIVLPFIPLASLIKTAFVDLHILPP